MDDLRAVLRLAAGRTAEPSAAIIDSRTLRSTPESGERAGYDGGKRKKGSKLHMAVDTLGHLLALHVTPASAEDRGEVERLARTMQTVTGNTVDIAYVDQGYTIGKIDNEPGKVDLRLNARRRLEPHFIGLGSMVRPDRGEMALHRRIGAGVAHFADLPRQPRRAQFREGSHPLAQEFDKGRQLSRPPHSARLIGRCLNAPLDIFADRLGVAPSSSRYGGYRYTLPMQFQDHHQFSKSDHPPRLHIAMEMRSMSAHPILPGLAPAEWDEGATN